MRLEITRRSDLALRALRAMVGEPDRLRSQDLAERLGSTPQFVPQVMNPMVRAGWVSSETGPRGGYQLSIDPTQHSVLELIELLEGPTDGGTCVLRGGPCEGSEICSLHDSWIEARTALTERLGSIPITTSKRRGETS
jgi:Rrf2 family protein